MVVQAVRNKNIGLLYQPGSNDSVNDAKILYLYIQEEERQDNRVRWKGYVLYNSFSQDGTDSTIISKTVGNSVTIVLANVEKEKDILKKKLIDITYNIPDVEQNEKLFQSINKYIKERLDALLQYQRRESEQQYNKTFKIKINIIQALNDIANDLSNRINGDYVEREIEQKKDMFSELTM